MRVGGIVDACVGIVDASPTLSIAVVGKEAFV
jgi:hypothetical protein